MVSGRSGVSGARGQRSSGSLDRQQPQHVSGEAALTGPAVSQIHSSCQPRQRPSWRRRRRQLVSDMVALI